MGGDHKCPVCQATFTRPQHVARHMRSHTGDRPYKCQYCGDQFARSDLLSRHVNKCHANEKPLPTIAGSRRKGSASASRATTSKQACDQCVQSSLPCDGCNPCAKCIQRKCRCTFVKFHRQTAPVGPGHNTNPRMVGPSGSLSASSSLSSTASSASRLPLYSQDDLLLAPAPGMSASQLGSTFPHSTTTMGENLFSSDFSFSPIYSQQGQHHSSSSSAQAEYAQRYKANADLLRRGSISQHPHSGAHPNQSPIQAPDWLSMPTSASGSYSSSSNSHPQTQTYVDTNRSFTSVPPLPPPPAAFNLPGASAYTFDPSAGPTNFSFEGRTGFTPGEVGRTGFTPGETSRTGFTPGEGRAGFPPLGAEYMYARTRQPPGSAESSDHGHGQEYASSEHSSSSGHFHFNGQSGFIAQPVPDQQHGTRPSSSSSHGHHTQQHQRHVQQTHESYEPNPHHQTQHHSHQQQNQNRNSYGGGEGEFSSTFGLMSLDDPNVLAGLATDGAPFFSGEGAGEGSSEGDPDATPMQGSGRAEDRNTERMASRPNHLNKTTLPSPTPNREMRDLWNRYMRTPLTGPGGGSTGEEVGAGYPTTIGTNHTSPQGYRRQRVSSLPSSKTPTALPERYMYAAGMMAGGPGKPMNLTLPRGKAGASGADAARGGGAEGTTIHGENIEDLRRYEAAVLARGPPATLSLKLPRGRRGTSASTGGAGGAKPKSASAGTSPQVPAQVYNHQPQYQPTQQHLPGATIPISSRPGSTESATKTSSSSLAHAFGKPGLQKQPQPQQRVQFAPDIAMTPPSVARYATGAVSPVSHGSSRGSSEALSLSDGSVGSGGMDFAMAGGDAGGDTHLRPSFKRLPSQTLGPASSKRALLTRDREGDSSAGDSGEGEDGGHDELEGSDGGYGVSSEGAAAGAGIRAFEGGAGGGGLKMGTSERRRRMSAPSATSSPTVGTFAAGSGPK